MAKWMIIKFICICVSVCPSCCCRHFQGDLSESPFAKALEKASHLLVVPNPTVGIWLLISLFDDI